VTAPFDRTEALRVLQLPPSADTDEVKRAYRRLARDHHPDHGGDVDGFHELQRAYEVLLRAEAPARPGPPRGRPSRRRVSWAEAQEGSGPAVDVEAVRWHLPVAAGEVRLDRDRLAVTLAAEHPDPVHPVRATSRAPGSRMNRAAAKLSPDLTSSLAIAAARDDRGRPVVTAVVTSGNRRARRALDAVGLEGGWVRTRGSATTAVRAAVSPGPDRRTTAVRVVDAVEALLARLDWPLQAWTTTD
jgi:hypothetical protein